MMDPPPNPKSPSVEAQPQSSLTQTDGQPNGERNGERGAPLLNLPERQKDKRPESKTLKGASAVEDAGEKKLSNKELKLRQKAEKQAKRAAQRGGPDALSSAQNPTTQSPKSLPGRRPSTSAKSQPTLLHKPTDSSHHKQPSFHSARPANLSQLSGPSLTTLLPTKPNLQLTSHLPPHPSNLPTITRDIHPAVLTLAVHLHTRIISGSSARCAATLLTFQHVISSYTTPPSVALPRHLTTYLSHQISFLTAARPLSIAQGNSIRWLKKLVVELDPAIGDADAKEMLVGAVDGFVRERVLLAGEVIAKEIANRIEEGDVVLVFGKSSVVEKGLRRAGGQGKAFEVVIVDAAPSFEGRNLLATLADLGLRCTYTLITGLAGLADKITKCFLGASAVLGNGALYARAGTALVAMMAKSGALSPGPIPILVCAESVKFSTRVVLDGLAMNELGDPDALIEHADDGVLTSCVTKAVATATGPGGKRGKTNAGGKGEPGDQGEDPGKKKTALEGWTEQNNLHLLNLVYDVTPPEYLDMVITELGCIPPSAVSAVNEVWGDDG